MKKFAAIFPGQGSQFVGMFESFMDNKIVADTFALANATLGYDLKELCLKGPESELNKTFITQPAILTASVAAYRAFEQKAPSPIAYAGHSLGEYSALVCAGAMEFEDALLLVQLRGQKMQEAVAAGEGAMAAVLGLEDKDVIDVCTQVSQQGDGVWAANFNSTGQIVISGTAKGCQKAQELLEQKGAKKVVMLSVSAPSHCPLMQSAADALQEALDKINLKDIQTPVFANSTASAVYKVEDIKKALIVQLTGPVRWVESVVNLHSFGAELLVELGPSKVLCGLNRRIIKELVNTNIDSNEGIDKALGLLA